MKVRTVTKAGRLGHSLTTDEDMQAINSFAIKELTADDVFTFKVKMADNSTDDRNKEPFTQNALIQLKELYVGKTVSKDHQNSADTQIARIYSTALTESGKSNGVNGEKVYDLIAKCYMARTDENAGLIKEIEAGIKREVSTSCGVSRVVCSICGTDLTEKYCKHRPGAEYDHKICYRLLDEIRDAYELSFVAVPAQPQAGTFKQLSDKELNSKDEKTAETSAEKEVETAIRIAEEFIYLESEEN